MATLKFLIPKYKIEIRKGLFSENFGDGQAETWIWNENSGTWTVSSGTQKDGSTGYIYRQANTAATRYSYYVGDKFRAEDWNDYYVECDFKIATSSQAAGIIFRGDSDVSNYYVAKITQGTTNNIELRDQAGTLIGSAGSATIAQNTWYTLKIICASNSIKIYIDDTLEVDTTNSTRTNGRVGFITYSCDAYFDNLWVYKVRGTLTDTTPAGFMDLSATKSAAKKSDSYSLKIANPAGLYNDTYYKGDEIHCWTGYSHLSPELTKFFIGIDEEYKTHIGEDGSTISMAGRDYTFQLLNSYVPEKYKNTLIEDIVKDLVPKYTEDVTAGIHIDATGVTLEEWDGKNRTLWQCMIELADLASSGSTTYDVWIDVKKDLYFKQSGATSSGITLSATDNIISADFPEHLMQCWNWLSVEGLGKDSPTADATQTTEDSDYDFGKATNQQKIGQTFKLASNSQNIFSVHIKPQANTGTPTDDIILSINTTVSATGLPTNSTIKSVVIPYAEWAAAIAAPSDIIIYIDVDDLNDTDTYAVVLERKGTNDDANHYEIAYNTAGGYANGELHYFDGTNWNAVAGDDIYFKVYHREPNLATASDPESIRLYKLRQYKPIYDETIKTATEAQTRVDALRDLYKDPRRSGTIVGVGEPTINAGETVAVTISDMGYSAETMTVSQLTHKISTGGFTTTYTLDNLLPDPINLLKEHENKLADLYNRLKKDKKTTTFIVPRGGMFEFPEARVKRLKLSSKTIGDAHIWGHQTAARGTWGTFVWGETTYGSWSTVFDTIY